MSCVLSSRTGSHARAHAVFNMNGKRPSQGPNPFAKRFLYMTSGDFEQRFWEAESAMKPNTLDDIPPSKQPPPKCSFLQDLPTELRIRIMEHILLDQPNLLATIHHYHHDSPVFTNTPTTRIIAPPSGVQHPLHRTCKTLHREFKKIQFEQARHVFHQPPSRDGIHDIHWFKATATHPTRHIKIIVEFHGDNDKRSVDNVVGCINQAFGILDPAYRTTFPEAETVEFVYVFGDGGNRDKAVTGIVPLAGHEGPFSTESRFDFWTKTEWVPVEYPSGPGPGDTVEEEDVLSVNNLHRLPALLPNMRRFDVDWTVTHSSAMGRLRFRARSVARVVSEAMRGFVDGGKWGDGRRATLQLRSINSDYGGTTQDLDFDTDRSV